MPISLESVMDIIFIIIPWLSFDFLLLQLKENQLLQSTYIPQQQTVVLLMDSGKLFTLKPSASKCEPSHLILGNRYEMYSIYLYTCIE